MKRYTLAVGLNDRITKAQKVSTLEAYKILENILQQSGVDGYSIYEARGGYRHAAGEYVKENSLIIEILDIDGSTDRVLRGLVAPGVKQALNQESVALASMPVESELL